MFYTGLFGPLEWNVLHRFASWMDELARQSVLDVKTQGPVVARWIHTVMNLTPCMACREHSRAHRAERLPVPEAPSWYRYTVQFHNHVNQHKTPASPAVDEDAWVKADESSWQTRPHGFQPIPHFFTPLWMYLAIVQYDSSVPVEFRYRMMLSLLQDLHLLLPPPSKHASGGSSLPAILSLSELEQPRSDWMERIVEWQVYWDPTSLRLSDRGPYDRMYMSMIRQLHLQSPPSSTSASVSTSTSTTSSTTPTDDVVSDPPTLSAPVPTARPSTRMESERRKSKTASSQVTSRRPTPPGPPLQLAFPSQNVVDLLSERTVRAVSAPPPTTTPSPDPVAGLSYQPVLEQRMEVFAWIGFVFSVLMLVGLVAIWIQSRRSDRSDRYTDEVKWSPSSSVSVSNVS